jgi:hypothetical protein
VLLLSAKAISLPFIVLILLVHVGGVHLLRLVQIIETLVDH